MTWRLGLRWLFSTADPCRMVRKAKAAAGRCSMSNSHADELRKARDAFVEDRRSHIKEAVSLLPANRHSAFQEAREALDLQAEIEALDRAIADEDDEGYLPKGVA